MLLIHTEKESRIELTDFSSIKSVDEFLIEENSENIKERDMQPIIELFFMIQPKNEKNR